MKTKNAVTKEYMKQNDRFADLCNYYLFHGEQVIRSEELVERDVTELALPYKNEKLHSTEKFRDLLKSTVIKQFKNSRGIFIRFNQRRPPASGDHPDDLLEHRYLGWSPVSS